MEGKRWQGTLNVALAGAFAVAAAIAGKQSITVSQQVHEISKLQEQSVGEASQCNSERDDLKANLARCRTDLAQCQTNLSTARTPVQPSGLPAAAQGSADLAAEPLQVTESDFTFSDPECRLSGSEITCGITVLNKAEERTRRVPRWEHILEDSMSVPTCRETYPFEAASYSETLRTSVRRSVCSACLACGATIFILAQTSQR